VISAVDRQQMAGEAAGLGSLFGVGSNVVTRRRDCSAIAANPALNIAPETGEVGRLRGLEPENGLHSGGVLFSNGNCHSRSMPAKTCNSGNAYGPADTAGQCQEPTFSRFTKRSIHSGSPVPPTAEGVAALCHYRFQPTASFR
jgi:hypothetical protein